MEIVKCNSEGKNSKYIIKANFSSFDAEIVANIQCVFKYVFGTHKQHDKIWQLKTDLNHNKIIFIFIPLKE